MKINSKTISRAVALSGVASLSAIICADNISNCYAGELLREIQAEQSKLPQVTLDTVMHNVFKNYDTLNHAVKDTLTTIWHNDAGNLLLRRLHKNIKNDTQKLMILWNACDEEGGTNLIRYDNLTIYLNT